MGCRREVEMRLSPLAVVVGPIAGALLLELAEEEKRSRDHHQDTPDFFCNRDEGWKFEWLSKAACGACARRAPRYDWLAS